MKSSIVPTAVLVLLFLFSERVASQVVPPGDPPPPDLRDLDKQILKQFREDMEKHFKEEQEYREKQSKERQAWRTWWRETLRDVSIAGGAAALASGAVWRRMATRKKHDVPPAEQEVK